MRKVTWGPESNAYAAVEEAIFENEDWPCGSYLVQLKIKYADQPEDKYLDKTELLIDDRHASGDDPNYVWEYDWWEGEEDVIILGLAKVEDIDLSTSFAFD